MTTKQFNKSLMRFIDASPTPFHATRNLAEMFRNAGFEHLREQNAWQIDNGKSYYVTRNDSSIIAFRVPHDPVSNGIRMLGAHTDSPCLKLKPNTAYAAHGYWQLGVEVYGGVLLNPWFDRDLSLAGRVTLKTTNDELRNVLINIDEPIATIPSLAIHLDREANKSRSINNQTYLPAIIALHDKQDDQQFDFDEMIRARAVASNKAIGDAELIDFELFLYPNEKSGFIGVNKEFIASARLDNLLSCFVTAHTMVNATADTNQLIVCNDHEEVGSNSTSGASGTFLSDILDRLFPENEARARVIAQSALISTDNAHGVHPNFADKHDSRHGPMFNKGPVIKINSNQAYATNSESASLYKLAASKAGITTQSFVTRSDLGCGSTIGPLTATALGVRTVDVGVPTFAMHSIRELAGSLDAESLFRSLREFFALPSLDIG